ncbi:pentapeptide repeat-containing protein [Rhizobium leguminosarum]|uniref:Pentapeptide repeat-containing protein n=1 Tax=Rhizobium leguminosarum TaxID=384 RepID=A0A2K9Z772_RHILE|nr:pentapeptide repeat-containing protein [Rhizobium leguminosarum]AUW43951.1 hypothetical protein CUJ84_Chr003620 [Rhizobium leguminosarum]
MIKPRDIEILNRLSRAVSNDFLELTRIAKLDPRVDFRGADLRGVDFGASDLSGFDFTEADLTGANLRRAQIRSTTFNRTTLSGAIMPPKKTQLVRNSRTVPSKFHKTVIGGVLDHNEGRGRISKVLVTMPPGTGRHVLLEAMLEALDSQSLIDDVLVVVESVVARDEYVERLASVFDRSLIGIPPTRPRGDPAKRVEVVNFSALTKWIENKSLSALRPSRRLNTVVILGERNIGLRFIRNITQAFGDCGIICVQPRPSSEFQKVAFFDLDFRLTIQEALSEGAIDAAKVVMPMRDLIDTLQEQNAEASGVYIVPQEEDVEEFANNFSTLLHNSGMNWRVIPVRDRETLDPGTAGTVLVMRPTTAVRVDWSGPDFTFVSASLSPETAEKIAYPRHRTNRIFGPVVYDFEGSMIRYINDLRQT